ncbi:MAG: phospholipase [Phycisphaerae bacterium]|nr:phospholipase [Phycisphaerae bacterium]
MYLKLLSSALLTILTMSSSTHATDTSRYEHGETVLSTSNGNRSYPYSLLKPANRNTTAPLVIFLHGAGERGNDNQRQLTYLPERFLDAPHLNTRDCFVLAPQCPRDDAWAPFGNRSPESAEQTMAMKAAIHTIRKILSEENIDTSRIYLTGLSMGGYGSWDLAARHPDWFAAVVPICGGGDPQTAPKLVELPIWAFHGDKDQIVPESASSVMVSAIRKEGGRPAYTVLPGVGHGSWPYAYGPRGAMDWMFSQRNPDPPSDFKNTAVGTEAKTEP